MQQRVSGLKLAPSGADVYAAPMRQLRCVWSLLGWASLLAALCAQTVMAQEAAGKGSGSNVLEAPPPAPELTELDDSPPAPPASEAAPVKPRPTAAGKAAGAASVPPAAKKAAPPAPPAKAAAPAPSAAAAPAGPPKAMKAELAAPAPPPKPALSEPEPALPEPGSPPPPPVVDGDFAGRADPNAPPRSAPQDDFEAEVQEVSHATKREYSVRIDLLNWLLLGRLSFELETGLWKFLSVQLTPVFVVSHSPIAINYAGLDDPLKQQSHGIGPISGISLGVGAWLWGEPFKGYVLRLELSNYAYSYRTADAQGPIDRVDFTERRALLFIGSHSRFGAFTFAGGFGLGYELHQVERCGLKADSGSGAIGARTDDCKGKQQIALDRIVEERANLNGPLHPVYFQARFSVGVVF
jgi:hypothetical protein